MAYAVIKNDNIKVYDVLPKSYHSKVSNVLGGFDSLPNEELEKHGFYPIQKSRELKYFEKEDILHFDSTDKVFKYDIIEDDTVNDFETEKAYRLNNLFYEFDKQLRISDRIVIHCLENNIEVEKNIKKERKEITEDYLSKKEEINNCKDRDSIFSLNQTPLKTHTNVIF